MRTKKWTTPSGRQRAPQAMAPNINFQSFFANVVLRGRLDDPSKRALHFQNVQYRSGLIDVVDALIEAMLDHQMATPKSKNECHAAWERSGTKRNERHAAWERFSYFYGSVECPKTGPHQMPQTAIFKTFFDTF